MKTFLKKNQSAFKKRFDQKRKERQEDEERKNKERGLQEFLEINSEDGMSWLMSRVECIRPRFKSSADIYDNDRELETSSLSGSSTGDNSRPVRFSNAPVRYSATSPNPKRLKLQNQKKHFDPNATYEIENIRSLSLVDNKVMLKVKWLDYPLHDSTWEPLENVKESEAFENFLDYEMKGEEEFVQKMCKEILEEQEAEFKVYCMKPKKTLMKELESFDPIEYRCYQVAYMLVKDQTGHYQNFRKKFRHMVVLNYFHELEVSQYQDNKAIAKYIFEQENCKFTVSIENEVDFDVLQSFEYLRENTFPHTTNLTTEDKGAGCKCENGCSRQSKCCPTMVEKAQFGYKMMSGKKRLRLNHTQMIYECSDSCSCGPDCLNRVTQQPRLIPLTIFKTNNGRGWGLKAKTSIPKGTYLMEYTGEIIDQEVSNLRGKEYDEIGQSYMFDLDYNEMATALYTIDAFKSGNLSRFINHSCEPNCRIWPVSTCKQNPSIYKICYFSERFIKEGEELTFDYGGRPFDGEEEDVDNNANGEIIGRFKTNDNCKCGSSSCRGFIFRTNENSN